MNNQKKSPIIQYFVSLDTVTKTLLSINVIAYILMLFSYSTDAVFGLNVEQLLTIGGTTGDSPTSNLLISMFLHFSFIHLAVNMIVLVF